MLSKPRTQGPGPALTKFTWMLPAGLVLDSAPMVSPDSRQIALVGKDATGRRLFVRAFDSTEFRAFQVPKAPSNRSGRPTAGRSVSLPASAS